MRAVGLADPARGFVDDRNTLFIIIRTYLTEEEKFDILGQERPKNTRSGLLVRSPVSNARS